MLNFQQSMPGQGTVRAASAVIIVSFIFALLYLGRAVFEPLAMAVLRGHSKARGVEKSHWRRFRRGFAQGCCTDLLSRSAQRLPQGCCARPSPAQDAKPLKAAE